MFLKAFTIAHNILMAQKYCSYNRFITIFNSFYMNKKKYNKKITNRK
jgi:hypothetical protein